MRFVLCFLSLAATSALARIGGGEHFDSGRSESHSGGDLGFLVDLLVWLVLRKPQIGIPLVIIAGVAFYVWNRSRDGDTSTRKALDRVEAERRTAVSAAAVQRWVDALKTKDPAFDLIGFFDRTKRVFLEVQASWFQRNLDPVRKYLSDATFQRLVTQLKLIDMSGKRDAIADPRVMDLQIIGLEQSDSFDSLHIRVSAQVHDAEAPANATDDEALRIARLAKPESFVEVWTFVRKPGAATKNDLSQGHCPNCGASFAGGAANRCEFCGAIVNSGQYDWVLSEITQGSQHTPRALPPDGFVKVRQSDPSLTTEVLEDRASLLFWKWIEAHALSDGKRLAKVATPFFLSETQARIAQGPKMAFADCAVGSVATHQLTQLDGKDVAAVEIRWSARNGNGHTQPQRSVMMLERRSGAKSSPENGMSTNRCLNCSAPLTDNGQPSCEFCGAVLAGGEHDWTLQALGSWEWWRASGSQSSGATSAKKVPDREERERLVYLMAAMATSDGVVTESERRLLKMTSERWGVPWANVELALGAPPDALFDKLMPKGSAEAASLLTELVQVALADGKIDSKERKMLEAAAQHLGLGERSHEFFT